MMHPFRPDDTDKDKAQYANDPAELPPIGDKETFTNVINGTVCKEIGDRDWRMPCYDTAGQGAVCGIDTDHGVVRIGFPRSEREQFFELRAEQADLFQTALEATLGMIKPGGSDKPVRWEGHCYNTWDEPSSCLIEATQHDAVRITYVPPLTGEQECSLELRDNQIEQFQTALTAAMDVCHADIPIHGEHWSDEEETDETEALPPCGMDESAFTREINKMVAADAPKMLALVEEIGDRVDAITIAYCLAFPDHAEVISTSSDCVRGNFRSPERARTLLSAGDKAKIRLVSVTEAQKQANTA